VSEAAAPTPENVVRLDRVGDVAVLTVDFPPVNALAAPMRDGLVRRLQEAFDDPSITSIVIIGANDSFIAGADIREFSQPRRGADLLTIQEMLEEATKPVVAAIDGYALGAGVELALAAPFRIATRRAMLGLPEVNLGLLPGGGGTQRAARLIGPANALDLILSGRHVDAPRAFELGLIDAIADGPLSAAAIDFARRQASAPAPYPKASARTDRVAGTDPAIFERARGEHAIKSRGMVAPFRIIDCIEAACTMSPVEGLAFEKQALADCQKSPAMGAQVHLFFAERAASKLGKSPARRTSPVKAVSVSGAAAEPVAMVLALSGLPVTLVGAEGDATMLLARARDRHLHADDPITASALEAAAAAITLAQSVDGASDAVLNLMHSAAGSAGSFALTRAEQGSKGSCAVRFLGPTAIPAVVEIAQGEGDEDDAAAAAIVLVRRAGIAPVITGGGANGVGERMLNAYRRACDALLAAPCGFGALQRALSEAGLETGRFRATAPGFATVDSPPTALADDEIVLRVIEALANEGRALIDEGVARRAGDIDVLCVLGLGFPRYRGGPMYWAERLASA
jgi:3-hydroxyacyl-CoA dehydrogenase